MVTTIMGATFQEGHQVMQQATHPNWTVAIQVAYQEAHQALLEVFQELTTIMKKSLMTTEGK